MPSTIIGLFPPPADLRFTEVSNYDTPYSLIGGFYQFDQRPYNDSDMAWQTKKPYSQKRSFTDNVTVLVQTNTYDTVPIYPDLYVQPYDGSIAIPLSFSGSPFQFGAQRIAGNYYTDPVSGTQYQLDSFQWKFRFDQLVTAPTDNGIYYLKMRIYGNTAGTEYRDYVSEPIFVYSQHLYTTLIEATYNVNRKSEGIVAGGWVDGDSVTVQHRVEGFPVNYEPQSVNVGYLQQEYLYLQQKAQSWRTWLFALGGISTGVPAYLHEKVSKAMESDIWKIDGKYFALNQSEGSSVNKLWQNTAPSASNLRWATTPIRERFSGEWVFVNVTPAEDVLILDPVMFPYALIPWQLETGVGVYEFPAVVVNDPTAQTALVALWNGSYGLEGTFYESGGSIYYQPVAGTSASIYGDFQALYSYFSIVYSNGATGGSNGLRYYGAAATRQVVDWGDGSAAENLAVIGSPTNVPHTFAPIIPPEYRTRVFHNNETKRLYWFETGTYYPVVNVHVLDHSGTLPSGLIQFEVNSCPNYNLTNSSLFDNCAANLLVLAILGAPSYTYSTPILNVSMPDLSTLSFQSDGLNSTAVDAIFNDFVSNVWNGTLTGGNINVKQNPPSTPAPPTAASLASRTALTTASWTLTTD